MFCFISFLLLEVLCLIWNFHYFHYVHSFTFSVLIFIHFVPFNISTHSHVVTTATESYRVVFKVLEKKKDFVYFRWSNKSFRKNNKKWMATKVWNTTYILNCDCFHRMSDESWGKIASFGSVLKLWLGWSTSRVMNGRNESDDLKKFKIHFFVDRFVQFNICYFDDRFVQFNI